MNFWQTYQLCSEVLGVAIFALMAPYSSSSVSLYIFSLYKELFPYYFFSLKMPVIFLATTEIHSSLKAFPDSIKVSRVTFHWHSFMRHLLQLFCCALKFCFLMSLSPLCLRLWKHTDGSFGKTANVCMTNGRNNSQWTNNLLHWIIN